jgi:transposase
VTTQETLPDLAVLRALVLTARAERDAERAEKARLIEERDQLAGQNDRLRHLIGQLQPMQFGRHSEKLDPDQLKLALENLEQAIAAGEAEQEKADSVLRKARSDKRRAGRGPLPEHLPRVEIVIAPEATTCPCCGGAMHVIGEDRSQRLDVILARYQVIYRQARILVRQGIAIDRATLAFWVGYATAEVKPVWRLMREELLGSTKLFVDETTAPVLDPRRGCTKKGFFWVLARDDRPWRGGAPPAVVYSYASGHSADHAAALLKGYTGVLQTDGYAAYRSLADPKRAGGPSTRSVGHIGAGDSSTSPNRLQSRSPPKP